jgi:hypothetical protein
MRLSRALAPAIVAALVLPLAACAPDPGGEFDLVRAGCPADIRVLADSDPRAELGALYALVGGDATIDAEKRTVSGSLVADGVDTGIRLTVVSRAPGAETSTAEALYGDPDLLLATIDADAAIVNAGTFPTVGIFAPLERDPQIILWDPDSYPNARSIAEIGVSYGVDNLPVPVLSAPGNLAIEYLAGSGLLDTAQPSPVYDGTSAAFVAGRGRIAQQGEVTIDPRRLQRDPGWGHSVRFELIEETGYPRYRSMFSARPDDVTRYADCFRLLVPMLQRSTVGFVESPDATAELIARAAKTFGTAPDYDLPAALRASDILLEQRLIDNGDDDTVGDVGGGRMQLLFDIAIPVFEELGYEVRPGLRPSDIATNAFIDPSIGL